MLSAGPPRVEPHISQSWGAAARVLLNVHTLHCHWSPSGAPAAAPLQAVGFLGDTRRSTAAAVAAGCAGAGTGTGAGTCGFGFGLKELLLAAAASCCPKRKAAATRAASRSSDATGADADDTPVVLPLPSREEVLAPARPSATPIDSFQVFSDGFLVAFSAGPSPSCEYSAVC